MMTLVKNATYRLESRADTLRSLNVVANSGTPPASLANVCLWKSNDSDTSQQWIYKEEGGNKYFVCKLNQNVALDLFTGSSSTPKVTNFNAHVYAPSTTSYLKFEDTSDTHSSYIRIRLANNTSKYLTCNQGSNGTGAGKDVNAAGNVYFYSGGLTDRGQDWKPIRLDGGGGTPAEVVVTNMPNLPQYYGTSLTEYFHPTSGMVPGTFYGTNNGQAAILNKILAFYKKAYRVTSASLNQYAYSLFGSKTITSDPTFNNTYHHGVDMVRGTNQDTIPVYTAHSGELIHASGNRIAIYDSGKNVTYLYLHCNIAASFAALKDQWVPADTQIGYQSNQGLIAGSGHHLHFEVKQGRNSVVEYPDRDLTKSLPSLIPYNYM